MNTLLQTALLRSYAGMRATGLLSTRAGRWAFSRAYNVYKSRLEAPAAGGLQSFVPAGSTVIDIGANVGFFTRRFATWVGEAGRVIALEPEPRNARDLHRALRADGTLARVQIIEAAAAESEGAARLKLNPAHPGDHRLTDDLSGVDVASVRLDDILAGDQRGRLALVKVDVQGAEQRVLDGGDRTLRHDRPVWFVEVDDDHLRAMGSSAARLIRHCVGADYSVHELTPAGAGPALDPGAVTQALGPGTYRDLLFKPC